MSQLMINVLITVVPWMLLIFGVMIAAGIDPYINQGNRRMIMLISMLALLLMLSEMTEFLIWQGEPKDLLRTCASASGYIIRPILLVLFLQGLYPYRRRWPFWTVIGINTAIYGSSIFTGIAFYIEDNNFHRGPLNYTCMVVSILLMLDLTAQLIRTSMHSRKREIVLILFGDALIALGIFVDSFLKSLHVINFLTIAIVGTTIFFYFWMHFQLARLHEEKLIENLQKEHHIQLMISQIQPHFLYNTLATIQALCLTDPGKASQLMERFGQYLRENLDSMNHLALIPFTNEMRHTRTYVEIEQVRFPSIRIEYDLQDMDFEVPALTVQPLVENAIRHGVRIRENGEIHITSRLVENMHVVTIWDNGKGFDAEKVILLEGQHIGIRNVRERVEQMCGGAMTIDSKIGEGATVTLHFPAGKEQA